MCVIIIFLSWLQEWLPMQNRQYVNKGISFHFFLPVQQKVSSLKISLHYSLILKSKIKGRRCETGFTWIKPKCIDIDECESYRAPCQGNLHCTNTVGTYICGCRQGYETIKTPNFELMKNIPSQGLTKQLFYRTT